MSAAVLRLLTAACGTKRTSRDVYYLSAFGERSGHGVADGRNLLFGHRRFNPPS
jgi:hypothetical protein